jgi:hypothetical protein
MNLVLLETSSNQRYIFATNRLRENVGASELTYRVGTKTVLDAVSKVTGRPSLFDADDAVFRSNLLNPDLNPPLDGATRPAVEVVVATSGKAILLVDGEETGKRIIRIVTKWACRRAPGLTVHGVIGVPLESLTEASAVHSKLGELHRKLESVRFQVPSQAERFQRLPFIAPCESSGLPSSEYDHREPKGIKSTTVTKKLTASEGGKERFQRVVQRVAPSVTLLSSPNALENNFKECGWTAVIHADGNGLGNIFLNFKDLAGTEDGRQYLESYRKFSLALDVCTTNAFGIAAAGMQQKIQWTDLPLVPIVLGGDDLTVICDGQYAIRFTLEFLRAFEIQTSLDDDEHCGGIISKIAFRAFGVNRLGICAGISIVKPHYPFHAAYELAESLLKSAKQVKHFGGGDRSGPSLSALDFHILYDSSASELDLIREKLFVDNGATRLTARPYVVSEDAEASEKTSAWLHRRLWKELENRVVAMRVPDQEDASRRALPNSQLHWLRETLFRGATEADAVMKLIRDRYRDKGFDTLLVGNSLFADSDSQNPKETYLLDAIDVVDFWK